VEHKICIMALYLLIWGEAANIRFLPECLCYIFHHMADEMYDLLEKPRVERSEKIYIEGSQHSFLEKIICPIHEILAAESDVPVRGRAAHSAWHNYDDFNEFFWCLLAYFKPYGLLWGSPALHEEIEFLFLYSVFLQVYSGLHMLQLKLKEF
jgi:hypothetical protein